MDQAFSQTNRYYSRKKFFKMFGEEMRIFDESRSRILFFVKQKAFKLKEELTVYSDETMSREVLKIKARSVLDFGATYDVTEVASGEQVGALRRKALRSMFRDSWEILGPDDRAIGTVAEDSMFMALLRRFLINLIPQSYSVEVEGAPAGEIKQTFNPFIAQFKVDFSEDSAGRLDRRLGIAAVVLLQVIEGRQE
ncbi:MAG: hypothetical protein NXI24_00070 [bacterium]|nr:hypothetical protein [bacterium]